jgi:hypothetical protein
MTQPVMLEWTEQVYRRCRSSQILPAAILVLLHPSGLREPIAAKTCQDTSSGWHILRPNYRDRVWCQDTVDSPTWTQITLNARSAVCSACLKSLG